MPPSESCTCDDYQFSSASLDCPAHGEDNSAEAQAQQQSEIDAENAWLRAAEAPTAEDYAFERYEAGLS